MACFSDSGILVPAGIVSAFGSVAAAGAGVAAGAALASALSLCGVSAACPNAIPDNSKKVHAPRITDLQNRQFSPRIARSGAKMLAIPFGVIQTELSSGSPTETSQIRSLRPRWPQRVVLQNLVHFLHPRNLSLVEARRQGKHVFAVASKFARTKPRRADGKVAALNCGPLRNSEYHDRNILPRILLSPKGVSDGDHRTALHVAFFRITTFPTARQNRITLPPFRQGETKTILRVLVYDGLCRSFCGRLLFGLLPGRSRCCLLNACERRRDDEPCHQQNEHPRCELHACTYSPHIPTRITCRSSISAAPTQISPDPPANLAQSAADPSQPPAHRRLPHSPATPSCARS